MRTVAGFLLATLLTQAAYAQGGTLAEPFPASSPNAALRYQRAILLMNQALSDEEKALVSEPIWTTVGDVSADGLPEPVSRTVFKARHAVEAINDGARLNECDFGIDFQARGAGTLLPHVQPMIQVGRLLTLRGAVAEAGGRWEEAAIVYFAGLRVGKHMTHQPTLLEALAGLEILSNNYFALARWAVSCPDRLLVARAFGTLETMSSELVDPARTLSTEASIVRTDFQRLAQEYPNGSWAELVLEGYGEELPADEKAQQDAAKRACLARGVPEEAFKSPAAFRAYLRQLSTVTGNFIEAAATSMTLPGLARIERGQNLYKKYSKQLNTLGDDTLLNPAEIARIFSTHDAELTVARIALALAASKKDGKYPTSLADISARFGGQLPSNPYDGSAVKYELDGRQQQFAVRVPATESDWITLPEISFESAAPAAVVD